MAGASDIKGSQDGVGMGGTFKTAWRRSGLDCISCDSTKTALRRSRASCAGDEAGLRRGAHPAAARRARRNQARGAGDEARSRYGGGPGANRELHVGAEHGEALRVKEAQFRRHVALDLPPPRLRPAGREHAW